MELLEYGRRSKFKEVIVRINLQSKTRFFSYTKKHKHTAETFPGRHRREAPSHLCPHFFGEPFFTDPEKIDGNSLNCLPQSIPPGDIVTMRRPAAETFTKIRRQIHQILRQGPRSSETCPRHPPGDIATMRRPPAETFPRR